LLTKLDDRAAAGATLVITGLASLDVLATGRLSQDAVFGLSFDDAAPVTVTVAAASTATNDTLADLIVDINDALTTAGLHSRVVAQLAGAGSSTQFGAAAGTGIALATVPS